MYEKISIVQINDWFHDICFYHNNILNGFRVLYFSVKEWQQVFISQKLLFQESMFNSKIFQSDHCTVKNQATLKASEAFIHICLSVCIDYIFCVYGLYVFIYIYGWVKLLCLVILICSILKAKTAFCCVYLAICCIYWYSLSMYGSQVSTEALGKISVRMSRDVFFKAWTFTPEIQLHVHNGFNRCLLCVSSSTVTHALTRL